MSEENRRQVSSRKISIFQKLAKFLVKMGLTPNQISILSMAFAFLGAWGLTKTSDLNSPFYFYLLALLGVQLRLVCNLIDGLMAVEGGLKTLTGEIYNDVPDRVSDCFLFLGAGLSISHPYGSHLGWLTCVLAILTAYVRVLGASMQQGHDFGGPTAKQHRMFILSLTIVSALIERILFGESQYAMIVGLSAIALGSLATIFARLSRLAKKLNQK